MYAPALHSGTSIKVGLVPSFFSILEEDRVSVKDSVTSGLLAHGFTEGIEVSGSSEHPMTPKFKFAKDEAATDADTNKWEKWHSCQAMQKRDDVDGSYGGIRMEVNRILGPCRRNNIVGGQIYRNAGCHLRGVCTLDC